MLFKHASAAVFAAQFRLWSRRSKLFRVRTDFEGGDIGYAFRTLELPMMIEEKACAVKAYVTGSSALFFWRRVPYGDRLLKKPVPSPLQDCPMNQSQLRTASLDAGLFGPAPIHLMVPSHELRISRGLYKYSIHGAALPEEAFRQVGEHLAVASPEYCLVQSSRVYPRYRLLELCMEICGTYALVKEAPYGFAMREYQLASIDSIQRFLGQARGVRGASVLQGLLQFVQEGSRSPMETRAYLLMCLPKRFGGYGLPKPVMNQRISLSAEERFISKRQFFECDLCWPEERIAVEYDGHADHAQREDRDRDSIKRNILLSKGFSLLTLTGGQIGNAHSFDKVVREVAKRLVFRLHAFPDNWEDRRDELRAELFKSMTRYGHACFLDHSNSGCDECLPMA